MPSDQTPADSCSMLADSNHTAAVLARPLIGERHRVISATGQELRPRMQSLPLRPQHRSIRPPILREPCTQAQLGEWLGR